MMSCSGCRRSDQVIQKQMENGHAQPVIGRLDHNTAQDAAEQAEASAAASDGAVSSLQDEILALGPEAAELHQRLAALFSSWLADEKTAAAELERRRKQFEADNVSNSLRDSSCASSDCKAHSCHSLIVQQTSWQWRHLHVPACFPCSKLLRLLGWEWQ